MFRGYLRALSDLQNVKRPIGQAAVSLNDGFIGHCHPAVLLTPQDPVLVILTPFFLIHIHTNVFTVMLICCFSFQNDFMISVLIGLAVFWLTPQFIPSAYYFNPLLLLGLHVCLQMKFKVCGFSPWSVSLKHKVDK